MFFFFYLMCPDLILKSCLVFEIFRLFSTYLTLLQRKPFSFSLQDLSTVVFIHFCISNLDIVENCSELLTPEWRACHEIKKRAATRCRKVKQREKWEMFTVRRKTVQMGLSRLAGDVEDAQASYAAFKVCNLLSPF